MCHNNAIVQTNYLPYKTTLNYLVTCINLNRFKELNSYLKLYKCFYFIARSFMVKIPKSFSRNNFWRILCGLIIK